MLKLMLVSSSDIPRSEISLRLASSWRRLARLKELRAPWIIIKLEQAMLWERRVWLRTGVFPKAEGDALKKRYLKLRKERGKCLSSIPSIPTAR